MTPLEIFEELKPLAQQLARWQRAPPSIEHGDLLNAGLLGLWQTCLAYHQKPLSDVRRLAHARIRGAMRDALRKHSHLSRRQPRTYQQVYIEALADHDLPDALRSLTPNHEERMDIERAIARLPPREKRLVTERLLGRSNVELAAEEGVSEPRISQLCARGLAAIKKAMND